MEFRKKSASYGSAQSVRPGVMGLATRLCPGVLFFLPRFTRTLFFEQGQDFSFSGSTGEDTSDVNVRRPNLFEIDRVQTCTIPSPFHQRAIGMAIYLEL